jgi:hypothetical protein
MTSIGSKPPNAPRAGGCQCGLVRYELRSPPLKLFVCHCAECRKQSASAFGISVIVSSAAFALMRGVPKRWSRPTDSGRTLSCYFCPDCGSRIWHGDVERDETIGVKGGSLDEPVDLSTAVHIWTTRALKGITIPEHAVRCSHEPA